MQSFLFMQYDHLGQERYETKSIQVIFQYSSRMGRVTGTTSRLLYCWCSSSSIQVQRRHTELFLKTAISDTIRSVIWFQNKSFFGWDTTIFNTTSCVSFFNSFRGYFVAFTLISWEFSV